MEFVENLTVGALHLQKLPPPLHWSTRSEVRNIMQHALWSAIRYRGRLCRGITTLIGNRWATSSRVPLSIKQKKRNSLCWMLGHSHNALAWVPVTFGRLPTRWYRADCRRVDSLISEDDNERVDWNSLGCSWKCLKGEPKTLLTPQYFTIPHRSFWNKQGWTSKTWTTWRSALFSYKNKVTKKIAANWR